MSWFDGLWPHETIRARLSPIRERATTVYRCATARSFQAIARDLARRISRTGSASPHIRSRIGSLGLQQLQLLRPTFIRRSRRRPAIMSSRWTRDCVNRPRGTGDRSKQRNRCGHRPPSGRASDVRSGELSPERHGSEDVVAAGIDATGGQAMAVQADVREAAVVGSLIEQVQARCVASTCSCARAHPIRDQVVP
jgi:hypothetical protein